MCSRGQVDLIFASTKSTYAVIFVAHHRWLGPVWPADLQLTPVLAQRLGVASGIVAQLAGLAALDDLPWLAVLELFESKKDSLLTFGIWLYALVPDARELVLAAYDKWSRIGFCCNMHLAIDPKSNENRFQNRCNIKHKSHQNHLQIGQESVHNR